MKIIMNKLNKKIKVNAGMTYVELIVVLSIFSVLSSVAIFNYGDFQANVDIRNLGSDIALKIVEAQKSSLNGLLPATRAPFPGWKPSYGVYFAIDTPKQFIYFADLDNAGDYDIPETLDTVSITKGNFIEKIESYVGSTPNPMTTPLSISFKRPDSGVTFFANGSPITGFDYIKINLKSPKGNTTSIKVYPSGRIQVN